MKLFLLVMTMLGSLLFAQASVASDKVNINTATVKELQTVKGIGEKTAKAIVQYRKKHGKFSSIADLENVKGIGEKKLKKMKASLKAGKLSPKLKKDKKKTNDKK